MSLTPEEEAELAGHQRRHANARARLARIVGGEEPITDDSLRFMERLDDYMSELEEAIRRVLR